MSEIVLVTGAAGFVGGNLLNAIGSDEPSATIVGWHRPPTGQRAASPTNDRSAASSSVKWQAVDLLDGDAVNHAIANLRPSCVYHCGGVADVGGSWKNNLRTLEGNVRGTHHLLEAIRHACLDTRVLIPGSALIYRPSTRAISENDPVGPVSPYGVSKLAQEMLGQQFANEGHAVLLTRSFTHFGPGQDVSYAASSFANQLARIEAGKIEPVIRVGFLDARRDLTDVRDTVAAYRALMAQGIPGRPYNICSGRAHKIRDVLDGLLRHSRVPVEVVVDPERLRPTDNPLLMGDPSRIRREIGWQPDISFDQTLYDLLDHWRTTIRST